MKKKGDVSFQGLTTPDKTFLYLSHKLSVKFKDSVVLASSFGLRIHSFEMTKPLFSI